MFVYSLFCISIKSQQVHCEPPNHFMLITRPIGTLGDNAAALYLGRRDVNTFGVLYGCSWYIEAWTNGYITADGNLKCIFMKEKFSIFG